MSTFLQNVNVRKGVCFAIRIWKVVLRRFNYFLKKYVVGCPSRMRVWGWKYFILCPWVEVLRLLRYTSVRIKIRLSTIIYIFTGFAFISLSRRICLPNNRSIDELLKCGTPDITLICLDCIPPTTTNKAWYEVSPVSRQESFRAYHNMTAYVTRDNGTLYHRRLKSLNISSYVADYCLVP